MITLEGKQIYWLSAFEHGFAAFSIRKGGKILYGVVHSDGRIRIEPIYQHAYISHQGDEWICMFRDSNSGWLTACLDEWNDMGKPLEKASSLDEDGIYWISTKKGGYKGIYKRTPQNVILKPVYRRLFWHRGNIIAKDAKNKWGVMTADGKIKIPFEYDSFSIWPESPSYFIARRKIEGKNKSGLIDWNGNIRIPLEYDSIIPINEKYIGMARELDDKDKGAWGIYDIEGNEIQPADQSVFHFGYKYIWFESSNPNEDILDVFLDGFAPSNHGGGIIRIDADEKTYHFIIPIANNRIHSCPDGNFIVQRMDTGKYGIVSSVGKGIIPCEYDYMEYGYDPDLLTVRKEEEWFCINSRNERVLF